MANVMLLRLPFSRDVCCFSTAAFSTLGLGFPQGAATQTVMQQLLTQIGAEQIVALDIAGRTLELGGISGE
jgi:hypothetical protein